MKSIILSYWLITFVLLGFSLFPTFFFLSFRELIDISGVLLGFSFSRIIVIFLVTICLISLGVFLWSNFYIISVVGHFYFYVFLLFFVCSILVLVLRNRFFLLFLGWEGLGVTSFVLVVFYQNWMSYGGGLLTLLTNRLGDGLLLIRFSYWILSDFFFYEIQVGGLFLFMIFLLLSFTKRAQVPFSSWLPAAIAAPTPVRALVHSSTLVTAGVWLMVRFGQVFFASSFLWMFFGLFTLLIASFAAIKEADRKKIVALSTLRQLGLMFLSLSFGGNFICLMHLLMHAFAKANLFLNVGSMLHFRFSQQDSRNISGGKEEPFIFISLGIRTLGLSGVSFFSGFFSKESILLRGVGLIRGIRRVLVVFGVIALTLSYCLLLSVILSLRSFSIFLVTIRKSKFFSASISFIGTFTFFVGYLFWWNCAFFSGFLKRASGFYWIFLVLGVFLSCFRGFSFWVSLFFFQKKIIIFFSLRLNKRIKWLEKLVCSVLESFYLVFGLFNRILLFSQFFRLVIIIVLFSIFLVFFYIKREIFC